jgi:hypothetical protein
MKMETTYVKKYVSPINYIIEQYRNDGIIRQVSENNKDFLDWIADDKNVLSLIPYNTKSPKQITLEEAKDLKIKEIEKWYDEEINKPLQVNDDPVVFIKQTESDLNLWEKGIKGFLLTALDQDYFDESNSLTEEEMLDLSVGTMHGSVLQKAKNYAVSPIDYYGKPLYITIEIMAKFTLKLAAAFQNNFMHYHLLKNYVTFSTNFEMLNYLNTWNADLSFYGYPPIR